MATPHRSIPKADYGWIAHRIVTYALQPPADNPLSSARVASLVGSMPRSPRFSPRL